MGFFEDGKWHEGRPPKNFQDGRWKRTSSAFRSCFPEDAFVDGVLETDRFLLIQSPACSWCHRVSIVLALRGLEKLVPSLSVEWLLTDEGWRLTPEASEVLASNQGVSVTWLRDLYLASEPHVSGTVTVPVLWDRKSKTIVK